MSSQHHIGWFEIYVKDFEKSIKFFTELFGWKFKQTLSKELPYWNIYTGEGSLGGGFMKKTEPEHSGQSIVLYVETENIEETLKRAVSLGGKIETTKTRISDNAGYFALFKDIDGNVIGLWSKS
jgi:uncharacterized protein